MLWHRSGKSPRLKRWLELENLKDKILTAVEQKQPEFPTYLLAYLSTAFCVPVKWFEFADWTRIVQAFYLCLSKSPKLELPITQRSGEKPTESPWDYPDRIWHLYSHMLAKSYGWTLEYISRLQVDVALARIEEIMVDEQLEREFYYSLSENAFEYDKRTQQSKFRPLPRPSWMRPKVEPEKIKKFAIPASMLPMGTIINNALPEELLPKEYETSQTQHP